MSCPHDAHGCWSCSVAKAIANGATVHSPNGLPPKAINDGGLFEHEHGDHPDYIFPVEIERGAPVPPWAEGDRQVLIDAGFEADSDLDYPRDHALIYTDGSVALTLYECCYAIFSLHDGALLGGELDVKTAKLSAESLKRVSDYCNANGIGRR